MLTAGSLSLVGRFPSNPYRFRPGPELVRADVTEDQSEARAELWIPVEREPQA